MNTAFIIHRSIALFACGSLSAACADSDITNDDVEIDSHGGESELPHNSLDAGELLDTEEIDDGSLDTEEIDDGSLDAGEVSDLSEDADLSEETERPTDTEAETDPSSNLDPIAQIACTFGDATSSSLLSVTPGEPFTCSATASDDADGNIVGFEWTVEARRSSAQILGPMNESTLTILHLAESYDVRVLVTDNNGATNSVGMTIDSTAPESFRIELTWVTPGDADPSDNFGADLDLHLLHPNGCWNDVEWDCHFQNLNPEWGAPGSEDNPVLSLDSLTAGLPEQIEGTRLAEGVAYQIGVAAFDASFGPSDVTLRVFIDGRQTFSATRTLSETNTFWIPATIQWPERRVIPVESISTGTPTCE